MRGVTRMCVESSELNTTSGAVHSHNLFCRQMTNLLLPMLAFVVARKHQIANIKNTST